MLKQELERMATDAQPRLPFLLNLLNTLGIQGPLDYTKKMTKAYGKYRMKSSCKIKATLVRKYLQVCTLYFTSILLSFHVLIQISIRYK